MCDVRCAMCDVRCAMCGFDIGYGVTGTFCDGRYFIAARTLARCGVETARSAVCGTAMGLPRVRYWHRTLRNTQWQNAVLAQCKVWY
eukprot:1921433-Rhodomonas_salina.1